MDFGKLNDRIEVFFFFFIHYIIVKRVEKRLEGKWNRSDIIRQQQVTQISRMYRDNRGFISSIYQSFVGQEWSKTVVSSSVSRSFVKRVEGRHFQTSQSHVSHRVILSSITYHLSNAV